VFLCEADNDGTVTIHRLALSPDGDIRADGDNAALWVEADQIIVTELLWVNEVSVVYYGQFSLHQTCLSVNQCLYIQFLCLENFSVFNR